MDNVILNTIKVSTKYLSLKNTLRLRRVCKKLKDKISQEFIIDIIKQRYAKYLKYGDKLCIRMRDFRDTTNDVNSVHFIEFNKMVTNKCKYYTIDDSFSQSYKQTWHVPYKIYPKTNIRLDGYPIYYYLDIPNNKIVSLNSQIRKHIGVSKFQEIINLCVDVINPTCDVRVFTDIYDLDMMRDIKLLLFVLMLVLFIIFGTTH